MHGLTLFWVTGIVGLEKIPPKPPLCPNPARRPTHRGPCSAMESMMDFLLDSAVRNSLRSPSGSTGNGLKPALRVNTLSTASACWLETALRSPHGPLAARAAAAYVLRPVAGCFAVARLYSALCKV